MAKQEIKYLCCGKKSSSVNKKWRKRRGRQRGDGTIVESPARRSRNERMEERVGESPRHTAWLSAEPCTARCGEVRRGGVEPVSVPRCTSRESRTDRTATTSRRAAPAARIWSYSIRSTLIVSALPTILGITIPRFPIGVFVSGKYHTMTEIFIIILI